MKKVPKLKEAKENSPWHFAFDWVLIQYLLFPTLFGRECRLWWGEGRRWCWRRPPSLCRTSSAWPRSVWWVARSALQVTRSVWWASVCGVCLADSLCVVGWLLLLEGSPGHDQPLGSYLFALRWTPWQHLYKSKSIFVLHSFPWLGILYCKHCKTWNGVADINSLNIDQFETRNCWIFVSSKLKLRKNQEASVKVVSPGSLASLSLSLSGSLLFAGSPWPMYVLAPGARETGTNLAFPCFSCSPFSSHSWKKDNQSLVLSNLTSALNL